MTKEQEEAIKECEVLKRCLIIYSDDIDNVKSGKAIETVLNMLKEKDAEVEKYKKKNKDLSNQILLLYKEQDNYNARIDKKNTELKKKNEELEMYKDIKEIANSKATELVKLKQYDDLKKKVDRQDKMIDLILEFLSEIDLGYYTKEESGEVLGIMRKYNKEDWKQYFEEKATNDG